MHGMMKRYEIQVLLRAGHTQADVVPVPAQLEAQHVEVVGNCCLDFFSGPAGHDVRAYQSPSSG